jgi:hypothetical protein
MGGLNEQTIRPAPRREGVPGGVTLAGAGQEVRVHEDPDTRQIHFHVDAEGLKAAVPVKTWVRLWLDLVAATGPVRRLRHEDPAHGTVLEIAVTLGADGPGADELEAAVAVRPLKVGPAYRALASFVE